MSSKYSVNLVPVSPYCREKSESLDFLFKNIWKPLYFLKKLPIIQCQYAGQFGTETSQKGQLFSTASLTHSYTGRDKFCPLRTASDVHIFSFGKLCFGTNAENKYCYPHQKLSFWSASDDS